MTERHGDRLVAGGSDATHGADPQGGAPAAEHRAEAIREYLMGAGPVATRDRAIPPSTGRSAAPETGHAAGPTGDGFVEPARAEDLRRRWDTVQASFVDDPRAAVEHAEGLAEEAVTELTAALEGRRRDLTERGRDSGTDERPETERLRTVMHGYRDILDRCLA
jgi:hypothetical protein